MKSENQTEKAEQKVVNEEENQANADKTTPWTFAPEPQKKNEAAEIAVPEKEKIKEKRKEKASMAGNQSSKRKSHKSIFL